MNDTNGFQVAKKFLEGHPVTGSLIFVFVILLLVITVIILILILIPPPERSDCNIPQEYTPSLQRNVNVAVAYILNSELDNISEKIQGMQDVNLTKLSCMIKNIKEAEEIAKKLNIDMLIFEKRNSNNKQNVNDNIDTYINNPSEGTEHISIYNSSQLTGTQKTNYQVNFVLGVKLLLEKEPTSAKAKFIEACDALYGEGKCPKPNDTSVEQNTTLAWIYLYEGRAWLDIGEDQKFSRNDNPITSYENAAESFTNALSFYTGEVITDCAQAETDFDWAELGCGVSYYRQSILPEVTSDERDKLQEKAMKLFDNVIANTKNTEGYVLAKAYLNRGTIYYLRNDWKGSTSDFQSSIGSYNDAGAPNRFVAEAHVAYAKALKEQAEEIQGQKTDEYTNTINRAITELHTAVDLLDDNELTEQDKRWFTSTIPIIKADALLRTAEITSTRGHDPTVYCTQVLSTVYSDLDDTGDTYKLQKALDSAYAHILIGDYNYYQKSDPNKAKEEYERAKEFIDNFQHRSDIPDYHPLIADMSQQIKIRQCFVAEAATQEGCFHEIVNDETVSKNLKATVYANFGAMYLEKPFRDDTERCNNLDKAAVYYHSCVQEAEQDPAVDEALKEGCSKELDNINKEFVDERKCQ